MTTPRHQLWAWLVIVAMAFVLGHFEGNFWHHWVSEDAEWTITEDEDFEETCTFIDSQQVEEVTYGVGM